MNILLILESPNKIHTVSEILKKVDPSNKYTVKASMGHITNLSKDNKFQYHLGVNLSTMEESYELDPKKEDLVKELRKLSNSNDMVYLATDNDFEGTNIAWHLINELNLKKDKYRRVIFNEITEIGIKDGLSKIGDIDNKIVNSSRFRRIIDRMVGFQTSDVSRAISAQSAGRVQSAALKLIVDREREINKFVPKEYYEIFLPFTKNKKVFKAQYKGTSSKKMTTVPNKEICHDILKDCKSGNYIVDDITEKERTIESKEPFTTATFQMEALAKFSMTSKRAMEIAQKLFEGKDIGGEHTGLISYHRTDSTRMSDEFVETAKKFICSKYTKQYYKGPKEYKKKANEQSAHECLRITNPELTPEKLKVYLDPSELKVYTLIYNRTLASLMIPSKVKDTNIVIKNNNHIFVLTGHKVIFDGFRKVYIEFSDSGSEYEEIPSFTKGEKIKDKPLEVEKKFTSPPSRYSEASFVKLLSEIGIGRPSTYSNIIETLKKRLYVKLDKKSLVPTELGFKETELMERFFSDIVDAKYTAGIETLMDEIAEGKHNYKNQLKLFWTPFHSKVIEAKKKIKEEKKPLELTNKKCPVCGAFLVERVSKQGKKFLACSKFPRCRHCEGIEENKTETKIKCPVCNKGFLKLRKNKKGESFYGCTCWSTEKDGCKFTMSESEFKKKYGPSDFTKLSTDSEI